MINMVVKSSGYVLFHYISEVSKNMVYCVTKAIGSLTDTNTLYCQIYSVNRMAEFWIHDSSYVFDDLLSNHGKWDVTIACISILIDIDVLGNSMYPYHEAGPRP